MVMMTAGRREETGTATRARSRRSRQWLNNGRAAVYVLPAAVVLIVFSLLPLLEAVRLSFTDWNGFKDPTWNAGENFVRLFTDQIFLTAFLNNCKLILAIPLWVALPFFIAQAIHARVFGWQVYRFLVFLPAVLSPVVLGIYYGIVFAPTGVVNAFLNAIGLGALATDWLNQPAWAFPILAGVLIWSTIGIGVLIFLAGFANLDVDVLEAARMDGANWLQMQRSIVFWLMMPVIRFWTVLIFIAAFTGIFPLVFALTRGGPGYSTYVLEFAIYQSAFSSNDLGYASAIGVFLLAFVAVVVALLFRLLKDRDV